MNRPLSVYVASPYSEAPAANAIARVVAYASAHGIKRFALLYPAGDYGARAKTALVQSAVAAGGVRTVYAEPQLAVSSLNTGRRPDGSDKTATAPDSGSVIMAK